MNAQTSVIDGISAVVDDIARVVDEALNVLTTDAHAAEPVTRRGDNWTVKAQRDVGHGLHGVIIDCALEVRSALIVRLTPHFHTERCGLGGWGQVVATPRLATD